MSHKTSINTSKEEVLSALATEIRKAGFSCTVRTPDSPHEFLYYVRISGHVAIQVSRTCTFQRFVVRLLITGVNELAGSTITRLYRDYNFQMTFAGNRPVAAIVKRIMKEGFPKALAAAEAVATFPEVAKF